MDKIAQKAQYILAFILALLFVVTFAFATNTASVSAQTDGDSSTDTNTSAERCRRAGGKLVQLQTSPPQTRCIFPDDSADSSANEDSDDVEDEEDDDTDDNDDDREPRRASPFNLDRPDRKNATATDRVTDRAEHMADRLAKACERLDLQTDRIERRMQAAIDRLENLHDRIDTRIEKFEELHPDVDLSNAKAHLEAAETLISDAQTALDNWIAEIEALVETCDDVDDLRAKLLAIREGAAELKSMIRAAHAELVEAIVDIRANLDTVETDENEDDDEEDGENDAE